MEKDLKLRFVCKWCDKKYPCGKSLGGHMRSHIIAANAAESDDKAIMSDTNLMKYDTPPPAMEAASGGIGDEFDGPSGGYGLRENPKKTWRAVGSTFPLQQDRYCKQCGKGFQSLKALCGHMACHSVKERVLKDDHSWTSEDPKLAIAMDGHSDNEETEDLRWQTRSKSKRYKKHVLKSFQSRLSNTTSNDYDSSFVSEMDKQEQEEVAMYLIMLSRDTRYWGGVSSVVESSDNNNSVILETKSSSIDIKTGRKSSLRLGGEALKMKKMGGGKKFKLSSLDDSHSGRFRNGVRKLDSDISFDELVQYGEYKKQRMGCKALGDDVSDAEMSIRSNKRECNESGVNKSFSVERGSSEFGSSSKSVKYNQKKRTIDGLNNLEDRKTFLRKLIYDNSSDGELSKNASKRSKYECLNCNKTFDSHQAFGGHRPCHKKVNVKFASKYESRDDTFPDSTPTRKLKSVGNKKQTSINVVKKTMTNKGQKCPICFRMFKSGQALGGHKRSHFINGSEVFTNQTRVVKQENAEIYDMIDLNLPASKEDEKD